MAKSQPENESKEERRARKAEKKAGKVDSGAISKPKSDKKDKKERKSREVLVERGLNEVNGSANVKRVKKASSDDDDDEENEIEETEVTKTESKSKKNSLANRPVGALVPFAHPLAEDKVSKKVFKAVKRGMNPLEYSQLRLTNDYQPHLNVFSNAA